MNITRAFYYNLIALAAVLWQTAVFGNAKVFRKLYTPDLPEIVSNYNKGTVTIFVANQLKGTGFAIENSPLTKKYGETARYIYTAAHVVKGASWVKLLLYDNEKDSEGNWKIREHCFGQVLGQDVKRDVALVLMSCDNCNCSRLGKLPARTKTLKNGEQVITIGNLNRSALEKNMHGTVEDKDVKVSLMSMSYTIQDKHTAITKFGTTAVQIKTGDAREGDSGSAILDEYGKVVAMVSAGEKDTVTIRTDILGVPLQNIQEASKQILNASLPYTVGCSADVSAFLGGIYWGNTSGNSINEMIALATAANAPYFAVAHDGHGIAHGYTFLVLRWEELDGDDEMKEDSKECLCETNPFEEGDLVGPHEEGMVMCGCTENTCNKRKYYEKNGGKGKERRWAIYKRLGGTYYVPSEESLTLLKEVAGERKK